MPISPAAPPPAPPALCPASHMTPATRASAPTTSFGCFLYMGSTLLFVLDTSALATARIVLRPCSLCPCDRLSGSSTGVARRAEPGQPLSLWRLYRAWHAVRTLRQPLCDWRIIPSIARWENGTAMAQVASKNLFGLLPNNTRTTIEQAEKQLKQPCSSQTPHTEAPDAVEASMLSRSTRLLNLH